jgi:membrane protein YdbS with pleckstrin-like domain
MGKSLSTTGLVDRAHFNPLIRPYLVLYVSLFLVLPVVTIPLAVLWFLGIGQWWARHYFEKLECELSDRSLRFRKGIVFQVEKTIPLENIQDVTFIEGPLLRRFQLSVLKFETAGQSAHGQANAMQLIGIVDALQFRNQILSRRDALRDRSSQPEASANDGVVASMQAIEAKLDEIIRLMRARG